MSPSKLRFALFAGLLGVLLLAGAQPAPPLGGVKLAEFPRQGEPPAIRLVSAGAEPRRELRYRFKQGAVHRMVMTMRMALSMEIDGRAAPESKMPAMRMVFDCRVITADDQQTRYEFSMPSEPELLETEGIQPPMLEAMRKGLGQLSSLRGNVVINNRGIVREARFEAGPGADQATAQMLQSMQQSMEQLSVPLPLERVGAGAQWKALQRVNTGGMTVYQVSTFTLKRLEGEVVTLAVGLDQYAPRQEMPVPEKAKGAKLELTGMQGRGEGQSALDLRGLVPRASAAIESQMAMNVQAEGKTMQMKMNNRMQFQVEPGALK